jgi:hypothetical protein
MQNKLKYVKILNNICTYYGIDEDEFIKLLKDRDNKYILLLILKNNHCLEIDEIKEVFKVKTFKSINSSLRLAEEKLLVNRLFREKYFELENNIEMNNMTNL